ncbi:hypothetical protein GGC47_005534 [Bosea sp. OAE752]|uniref:hypothetical protein n=1 Tax=Bosea sp. OAE752 TaxID=2663873 RepID=UPI003D1CFF68
MNVFARAAIAADLSWVPDMAALDGPPVTAESFVKAYLADPSTWHWSTDMLNYPREIVLRRVLAIIAQARLPDHQLALGQLGAGPLEDLMSDALLEDLRTWMPFTPEMRYALGNVRMNVEPPTLRHRLEAMLLYR